MPAYADLIRQLDIESSLIEIEATIIDINTDRSRELGINWRYAGDDIDVSFTNIAADGTTSLPGGVGPVGGGGGVLSAVLGESGEFLSRIRALEERGAARIVSKPHVVVLSDIQAVLGSTTEFFVRIAGLEQVDLFNVPVGTVLRVTPHVFRQAGRDRIKLLVDIEDGTPSRTSAVDSIPVIERAVINTQAIVNDGDSLLLGGLVRESWRQSESRVPWLGSIPLIGRLFRSDGGAASRVERLFLITPRLADSNGFGDGSRQPRLDGKANEIIAQAGRRLDSVQWPERDEPRYWPKEQEVTEPVVSAPRLTSPFTVKAWTVE